MNPKVDFYFDKEKRWKPEIEKLRIIANDCGLKEDLKWGCPCYTLDGKNIVLIHVFKEYCALLLFKGALLKDPKGILVQQTENVQSARQIRFTSLAQIVKQEPDIRSCISNAIEVEEKGLKVTLKKTSEYEMPEELQSKLESMPKLKTAFESITPGRQRAYMHFISSAKQSATREARIEKYIPKILKGKGMNDD